MRTRIYNISTTILFMLSVMQILHAQDTKVVTDMEQWTSIGISKEFNKHWKLSLGQEFRFTQDMSRFDTYLVDLGVDYKLNKHFSFGLNYRFYQNKNSDEIFKTQHRFNTDIQYKHKLNRFTLAYRIRLQNKDESFFTSSTGDNLYNIRNKFSVEYNINNVKLDPFFDVELYRSIENAGSTELSKLRWTLGVNYSLKKHGAVELFYRLDNELNQTYNKDTYIIGLGYKFSF